MTPMDIPNAMRESTCMHAHMHTNCEKRGHANGEGVMEGLGERKGKEGMLSLYYISKKSMVEC